MTAGSHCSVCNEVLVAQEIVPAAGHSFGSFTVTQMPTCTAGGSQTRVCAVCGAAEEEALPAFDCPCSELTDVSQDAWYHDAVDFMIERNLMNGVGGGRFDPEGTVTRAQLVTVLYRIAGEPETEGTNPFTDVKDGRWYSDAIAWAAQNGVVNGIAPTLFEPDSPVTREQIAAILFRYTESEPAGQDALDAYPDVEQISAYAREAMGWAVIEGLISGSDGELLPRDGATRAQIATVLMRWLMK